MKTELIHFATPCTVEYFGAQITQLYIGQSVPIKGGGGKVVGIEIDERNNRAYVRKTEGGWLGRNNEKTRPVLVMVLPPGCTYAVDEPSQQQGQKR